MTFADDQLTFNEVFGPKPTILHVVKCTDVISGNNVEDPTIPQQHCKLDITISHSHSLLAYVDHNLHISLLFLKIVVKLCFVQKGSILVVIDMSKWVTNLEKVQL